MSRNFLQHIHKLLDCLQLSLCPPRTFQEVKIPITTREDMKLWSFFQLTRECLISFPLRLTDLLQILIFWPFSVSSWLTCHTCQDQASWSQVSPFFPGLSPLKSLCARTSVIWTILLNLWNSNETVAVLMRQQTLSSNVFSMSCELMDKHLRWTPSPQWEATFTKKI